MSDERKKADEDVEAHRFSSPTEERTGLNEDRTGLNDTEEEDVEAHRLSSPAAPGRLSEPERKY